MAAEGSIRVFIDSVWWPGCSKYVGNQVKAQCAELQHSVIKPDGKTTLKHALEKADLAVIDLVRNGSHLAELMAAIKQLDEREEPLKLIGISTFMTWNKTRTTELKLDETLYTRRGCTPKYKPIRTLETLVINCEKPGKVESCVVAPGVLYGCGEDADEGFFSMFKNAWMCEPVGYLGEGKVVPPTIHVSDLAKVIFEVQAESPEKPYVVAVDKSKATLADIASAVSKALGLGVTENVPVDSVKALAGSCGNLEMVLFDKSFKPGYVAELEEKEVSLDYIKGPVAYIEKLCKEFVSANNLKPVKICLYGRPGTGRAELAAKLAKKYYIESVSYADAFKSAVESDKEFAAKVEAVMAKQKKKDPKGKNPKSAHPPAEMKTAVLKMVLRQPQYRNKGFVLSDYPTTAEEAKGLCILTEDEVKALKPKREEGEEEEEEEQEAEGEEEQTADAKKEVADSGCCPEFVVDLQMSRSEAKRRLSKLFSDEDVKAKMDAFDKLDKKESPLDVFRDYGTDVLEISPAESSEAEAMELLAMYIEKGSKPNNFHPTPEESYAAKIASEKKLADEKAKQEAELKAKEEAEAKLKKEIEQKDTERRKKVMLEEQALVENCSMPLRKYLIGNVIPPLIKGLLETCKIQPEDPIDYLAEYLFKHAAELKAKEQDA